LFTVVTAIHKYIAFNYYNHCSYRYWKLKLKKYQVFKTCDKTTSTGNADLIYYWQKNPQQQPNPSQVSEVTSGRMENFKRSSQLSAYMRAVTPRGTHQQRHPCTESRGLLAAAGNRGPRSASSLGSRPESGLRCWESPYEPLHQLPPQGPGSHRLPSKARTRIALHSSHGHWGCPGTGDSREGLPITERGSPRPPSPPSPEQQSAPQASGKAPRPPHPQRV